MSRPDPQATAPNDPTVASSCLDFLLIELVPLAQRITDQLHARDHALRAEYARSQIFHDQPPAASTTTSTTKPTATTTAAAVAGTLSPNGEGNTNARDDGAEDRNSHGQVPASSQTDASSVGGGGALTDTTALGGAGGLDDETRDAVFWRLDGMGYRVGQGLVERYVWNCFSFGLWFGRCCVLGEGFLVGDNGSGGEGKGRGRDIAPYRRGRGRGRGKVRRRDGQREGDDPPRKTTLPHPISSTT